MAGNFKQDIGTTIVPGYLTTTDNLVKVLKPALKSYM